MLLNYLYNDQTLGIELDYQRLGHDFRADNGFIPQVGVEKRAITLRTYFYPDPDAWITEFEPGIVADSVVESGEQTVSRSTYPYVSLSGKWKSSLLLEYHIQEQVRAATQLLEHDYLYSKLEVQPSRRVSRLAISGQIGEQADVVNERVGRGGTVSLNASFRPGIHISAELQAERQWLNIGNQRLFTADITRLTATYNFSSHMFLRVIGEYERIDREPSLYLEPIQPRESSWGGSLLYGYHVNWKTVIYAGYSHERQWLEGTWSEPGTEHFFAKLTYAVEL